MTLFGRYLKTAVVWFFVSLFFIVLSYANPQFKAESVFFLGVVGIFASLNAIRLLFAPEEIKGVRGTYHISPDLMEFTPAYKDTQQEEILPDKAFCGECGREVHRPFRCPECGLILCGKHYLKGEHRCYPLEKKER